MYPRTASFTESGNCEMVAETCSRTRSFSLASSGTFRSDQALASAVAEVLNVSEDSVVHRKRQLRDGGRDLLPYPVLQLGIHGEGHFQDVFEGGLIELVLFGTGGSAHARQVEAVNGVHHGVQMALVDRAAFRVQSGRVHHQVDGGIELRPGVRNILRLVVSLAALEPLVGLPDHAVGPDLAL